MSVSASGCRARSSLFTALSLALLLTGTIGCAGPLVADQVVSTEEHPVRVVTVARGLEHPWGLAFLPDGRMLVTERPGRLRIVAADGSLDPEPVPGVPEVAAVGQGGLLDVALDPDYGRTGWIYLSYVALGRGGIGTELVRARLEGNRLRDQEVLFRLEPKSDGGRHFGGRIVFDPEGYLYLTLGDRGDRPRAQDLGDHAGSVIRLNADGSVPDDNPFADRPEARKEIYTYGNRNVQGATRHPGTGAIWTHEHGPQGGDEVNIIRAGTNYGWPVITYGVNYWIGTQIGEGTHKAGMAQPLYYWVPSIAPSGMAFYTGERFPEWQGDLFVGALKDRLLVRLELQGEEVTHEERMLEGVLGRIRDVRDGPDGLLYLLTDSPDGALVRLEPAP
jgi:glucose/arabinose dehydrogenase